MCLPWGFPFCSRGAVSSFSSSCYGCCQLLLRLLGVFLLLVLVHLRFFHLVSCGWLPFWGSPAGYSFPNGRPYGKRSSSSSRPGGRRRFIGVRGVGAFFRAFGFPEVGAVSFPYPFRRLSVPPLAGLEGQGCGDLGCRGAAAGLLSALPQHSSSSIVPIPMPSSSPISNTGAALEEVTLGLIAKGALELAPLPSPGFYSHLFVVWKTSGSWRPVIDLSHLIRFVDVSHFQMETIQSVLLSVRQGDWMASIDLKEAYLQVPVHPASRHFLRFMLRGTVYQFKALCFGLSTAPQVFTRVMAPVSAILHSLGIRMRRYLDDWLVQSSSRESLLEDLHTVLQLCQELGIVINPQKSNLIPSQVVQYLGVVIVSTSFRASPLVDRISRLRSTAAEFQSCASPTANLWLSLLGVLSSLAHLVPGGRLRLRSLQLCLHRSWNRQDLEAPVLVSMECLHDLQWWLHLPRLSLGVSLRQVLQTYTFGPTPRTWDGVPISVVRSLPACGPPNRQRCLLTPGNCSLFSWDFSSSGQLSTVARWLSFATTPQQWLTFARRVAPGLLSSTPWLRRSCAGRSPSPSAWLHSSFRAPTTS